eukprot:gnl/Spiro4/1500_TR810_c0_g1_i1.p1 gnl/Spiro4/1500_TR810_c0_g1~~gnl/Spiro4/1500_TR810_c0_g1_i1.p1  ORF type:complete len:590 (-),score=158.77 gnl/Spiro4/1500_TR810_c0_g1_i1:76-1845(-)
MSAIVLLGTAFTCAMALLFDFTNGFHDAANAASTVIATKSLPPLRAVQLSALFNFLPVFVMGSSVANSVAKIVDTDMLMGAYADPAELPLGVRVTLSALLSSIFWNYFTWSLGMPSSSSHALIGGLVGAAVRAGGVGAVRWSLVVTTVEAIVVSPVVAFSVAFVAMLLIQFAQKIADLGLTEDSEFFRWCQIASSAVVSWGHGSNDAQKTVGVIAATLHAAGMLQSQSSSTLAPPVWVMFAANTMIASGTLWGGWKIIETMGLRFTLITRASGVAANIGAVTSIFGATELGIPISTTHAAASSVIGSGVGAQRNVNWRVLLDMVIAWVLTLPVNALIGYLMLQVTILPDGLAILCTALVTIILLAWAVRLMVHSNHGAEEVNSELPTDEELGLAQKEGSTDTTDRAGDEEGDEEGDEKKCSSSSFLCGAPAVTASDRASMLYLLPLHPPARGSRRPSVDDRANEPPRSPNSESALTMLQRAVSNYGTTSLTAVSGEHPEPENSTATTIVFSPPEPTAPTSASSTGPSCVETSERSSPVPPPAPSEALPATADTLYSTSLSEVGSMDEEGDVRASGNNSPQQPAQPQPVL